MPYTVVVRNMNTYAKTVCKRLHKTHQRLSTYTTDVYKAYKYNVLYL